MDTASWRVMLPAASSLFTYRKKLAELTRSVSPCAAAQVAPRWSSSETSENAGAVYLHRVCRPGQMDRGNENTPRPMLLGLLRDQLEEH